MKSSRWTPALDNQLRRLRAEGNTWEATASAMKLSLYTTIERGRRLNARRPPPEARPAMPDLARPSLPSGHRLSWNAINRGTSLDGETYPHPVFE
jgi:hypothetical protein